MRASMMALALLAPGMMGMGAGTARAADFALDFSSVNNPSGAWSYGWTTAPGGAFVASGTVTSYATGDVVKAWSPGGTPDSFWPTVGLNTGAGVATFGQNNAIVLQSGEGLLHPGPTGHYADARLTLAAAMTGVLSATFVGVDLAGSTTDVHVYRNGASLFDGAVNGYGSTQSYAQTLSLAAGDVIDFLVGWGADRDYTDDSTGFHASLTAAAVQEVPEPGSLAVLAAGAGMIGVARRIGGRARGGA